jgi:hypothetical protein
LEAGIFILSLVVASSPFLTAVWNGGFGKHILAKGVWNDPGGFLDKLSIFFKYWEVLFGATGTRADYEPPIGGILNPVLSSFFLLGLIEVLRRLQSWAARFFCFSFVLLMAEGFMSMSVEVLRIVPVLPFLIFGATVGFQATVKTLPSRRVILFTLIVLTVSFGVDLYRFVGPYWNVPNEPQKLTAVLKSPEKYRAYQILDEARKVWGPGLIFTDLIPSCDDESLAVITYPYNAAWNDALSFQTAQWAGIFTRKDYLPLLTKRFPAARWSYLPSAIAGEYSHYVLLIVPVDQKTREIFTGWKDTYGFFMNLNVTIASDRNGKTDFTVLKGFADHYPSIPNDVFLQSCFLDRLISFYMIEKTFHPEDTRNQYSIYSSVVKTCLSKSYPNPMTYEKLGRILTLEGQYGEAEVLLKKALILLPGDQAALADLKMLEALKRHSDKESSRKGLSAPLAGVS